MSDLKKTNLVIVASQLPGDFLGDPQDFFQAILDRMEIKSPSGTSFFIISDAQPTSDSGPWFKGGTKLYVFDPDLGAYVPLDISDSETVWITTSSIAPTDPGEDDPKIWRRVNADGTRTIGLYFWNDSGWKPATLSASGSTTSRPSDPIELEQYFDTDIKCLIHWERGQWRTVSGTPGDIKFVTTTLLTDAIRQNPGWAYVGETENGLRGRAVAIATSDGASVYAPDSGIATHLSTSKSGEEFHTLTSLEIEQHTHILGAITALTGASPLRFFRVEDDADFTIPETQPPNYVEHTGAGNPTAKAGNIPDPDDGCELVTSRQLSLADASALTGAAQPHNVIQPTVWFWCLQKT